MSSLFVRKNGFTLVELMVALFLGTIAAAGIYKTYVSYSTAADTHEQALELQQNLRVSMSYMEKEIRMAGFDPTESGLAGFFATTGDSSIRFKMDLNKDGDVSDQGEDVGYFVNGPDGDGLYGLCRTDFTSASTRYINKNMDPPAAGVMPLNFVYFKTTAPLTTPVTGGDLEKIKVVEISMVLRSANKDHSYTNTNLYTNLQGTQIVAAQNDGYYRRRETALVNVRNMGLSD